MPNCKNEHAVVIVGAGPTGLMLAGELALAGVDVAIVERRFNQELSGSRSGGLGLHARSIEVLDQRGIAERFISEGQKHPVVRFHVSLDISDFPTRHNYVLGLKQKHIERILAEWVGELRVAFYRGNEVTGFVQDDTGVDIALGDGDRLRASYLVGCDGGRSLIRKLAGIEFRGWDASSSWIMAEARTNDEPEWGFRSDRLGINAIGKSEDGRAAFVLAEPQVGATEEPTLTDVSAALRRIYGTDFGIHSPNWVSRFTDVARQAASYRDRRVLLAGDAAHIHAPLGGMGLNTGIQDAVNLGWKLAQVVERISPESLLDSYEAERHPVAARVLKNTMAHVAIRRQDERTKALAEYVAEFLSVDGARKRMAGEITGLDIRYDLGDGHPQLGRRMPDLDLDTASGPQRMYTLLRDAQAVLLNLGPSNAIDISPGASRVRLVNAAYRGAWELPVLGAVAMPSAVLIRPDGHVEWVGSGSNVGLNEALVRWFGRS